MRERATTSTNGHIIDEGRRTSARRRADPRGGWRRCIVFPLAIVAMFAAVASASQDASRAVFSPQALVCWERFLSDRDDASAKALVACGVDVVLPIVDAVEVLPAGTRRDVLDLLDDVVDDAPRRFQRIVPALITRLAIDEPRWRRRAAAVALRDNARFDPRLGALARSSTSDADPVVRTCSITAVASLSSSIAGPEARDHSRICAAVTDPSRRVRAAAVEALWYMPEPSGVEVDAVVASLWRLTEIGDADERFDAVTWLARFAAGHPANRARFESMLESADGELRRLVIAGLLRGGSLDPETQRRLRGLVVDEGRGISGRDFRGESEYFERLESAGFDPIDWVRREHPDDVDWLLAAGRYALRNDGKREHAYEVLLRAMELEPSGGCTSGCAVSQLRAFPSSFLAMVAPRLDDESDMVRIRALEVVAGSRPPTAEAARLLASRLSAGTEFERERALRGLAGLGALAQDAFPELREVYGSTELDDYERARILECAASIGSEASSDWLRAEFENPELAPRLAAIALRAVVEHDGTEAHRERIARLLDSGSNEVARTVYSVLADGPAIAGAIVAERLAHVAADPERLERELDNGLGDAILAARLPAAQVIPAIAWRLRDERGLLDWNVLDVLSGYGADARDAIPDLVAAFEVDPSEDEDGMERTSIAVALAAIDPVEGIARLTELVDVADAAIDADSLVDGLRETGLPEAIDPLMRLFEHEDPDVSQSAAIALIDLRADPDIVLPRIVGAIDRGVYDFPYEVVERIGDYGDAAAGVAPWLLESLRTDSVSRIPGALAAAEILAGSGDVPPVFDDLVTASIREGDYTERAWMLYARARVAGEEDRLATELDHFVTTSPSSQHEVVLDVLERLGPIEATLPLLERLATDPTHPDRETATALLAKHRAEARRAPSDDD